MTDYIGAAMASAKDLKHYGRKGMKWGQRIFSRDSKSSGGGEKTSKAKTETSASAKKTGGSGSSAPAKRPPGNIQDNVESSSARYDRLTGIAKSGRAHEMTEQDLKFYNARTEALAKINKMNEEKPSWLRETTTKVIQQSAQRQMQTVADAIADKYVGDPIKAALKGAADTASAAKAANSSTKSESTTKSVAEKVASAAKTATQKTETADAPVAKANPKTMRFADAIQYFKDNPSETPVVPDGYSSNAAKIFMDEVKRARGN